MTRVPLDLQDPLEDLEPQEGPVDQDLKVFTHSTLPSQQIHPDLKDICHSKSTPKYYFSYRKLEIIK